MGLDLRFTTSKTCILPRKDEETKNNFIFSDFVTLSCNVGGYDACRIIEENCDYIQKDVGTEDFHFDNYIYLWDNFMGLQTENKAINCIQDMLKEQERTNYIFLEVF